MILCGYYYLFVFICVHIPKTRERERGNKFKIESRIVIAREIARIEVLTMVVQINKTAVAIKVGRM